MYITIISSIVISIISIYFPRAPRAARSSCAHLHSLTITRNQKSIKRFNYLHSLKIQGSIKRSLLSYPRFKWFTATTTTTKNNHSNDIIIIIMLLRLKSKSDEWLGSNKQTQRIDDLISCSCIISCTIYIYIYIYVYIYIYMIVYIYIYIYVYIG